MITSMRATDILVEEHNLILKVLECTEKIVVDAESTGKLNESAAEKAIDFFRNFADQCHHAKEEDSLFSAMEEHGFPRSGGPTGVMMEEHEVGRSLISNMAVAVEAARNDDSTATQKFAENAREFITLLTDHIAKENQMLFPMAGQALEGSAQDRILEEFRKIEAEAGGKRHLKYISLAKELCFEYGVVFLEERETAALREEFGF